MAAAQLLAPPWSQTITEVIEAEHTLTISGYNLLKGSGSCDPVSSARFTVGGHEWVLLVYPEGKSDPIGSGDAVNLHYTPPEDRVELPPPAAPLAGAAPRLPVPAAAPPQLGNAPAAAPAAPQPQQQQQRQQAQRQQGAQQRQQPEQEQEPAPAPVYVGIFAALVGEAGTRQGVVETREGPVVRVFHQFTLVNQNDAACSFTRGRYRNQGGAIIIGAAYGDPASRNVHGYRKFVKQDELEVPGAGWLKDDTLIVRYKVELLVTRGGGLSRGNADPPRPTDALGAPPEVPPSRLKHLMYDLLIGKNATGRDFAIFCSNRKEGVMAHPFILMHRSSVLAELMATPGTLEHDHKQHILGLDLTRDQLTHMLIWLYTGQLWGDEPGEKALDEGMLPNLLAAGHMYEVEGLKAACEARLAAKATVSNALELLELAQECHAQELTRACLRLVADNLPAFVGTEPYAVLIRDWPELEAQLLEALAAASARRISNNSGPGGDRRPWPLLGDVFDRVGLPGPQPDGAVNGRRVRARGADGAQPAA